MAFNIDENPENANWLRNTDWKIPSNNLVELLDYLGVANGTREEQESALNTFMDTPKYVKAPALLKQQANEFINGFEIDELSDEVK